MAHQTPLIRAFDHSGEQFGEVDALPSKMASRDLGAAGESVGEYCRAGRGVPDSGPQAVLGAGGGINWHTPSLPVAFA